MVADGDGFQTFTIKEAGSTPTSTPPSPEPVDPACSTGVDEPMARTSDEDADVAMGPPAPPLDGELYPPPTPDMIVQQPQTVLVCFLSATNYRQFDAEIFFHEKIKKTHKHNLRALNGVNKNNSASIIHIFELGKNITR